MRGKYITLDIKLAYLSRPSNQKKDVYAELNDTIAYRRKIMQDLEKFVEHGRVVNMFLNGSKAA